MAKFLVLARKETATLLLIPAVYFAGAFVVLLDSFVFYLIVSRPGARAVFDDMAVFMLFSAVLLYPLAAMRSFADENADGTIETLLTAPVGRLAVVMAKFLALMVFVVLSLLPGAVYALLLSHGGNLDWRAAGAALLSLFLSGAVAMSIGLFVSTLTVSPVAGAGATFLILLAMVMAADVDPYAGRLAAVANAVSYVPHSKRWIAGELDTRGLVYFVSVAALFLFYAWLAAGARGGGGKSRDKTARRRMTVTFLLVSCAAALLVIQAGILHVKGFWESGSPILGAALRRVPWPWLAPFLLAVGLFVWSAFTYRAARRAERRNRPRPIRKYVTITDSQVMSAPRLYSDANRAARVRSVLAALAALAIVVNLNWLARYPFHTFANSRTLQALRWFGARNWDVTSDGRNSLSPSTRRTLDALQGQAHVYCFLSGEGDLQGVPLSGEMRRLLGRYGDYNDLVVVTYADPDTDPDRAMELAEELELSPDSVREALVVAYNGRSLRVPASALVSPPDRRAQMAGDARWVFDGEKGVTQALMRLLDPRIPNVYFASGHRELTLLEGTRPENSASRFAADLVDSNLRVKQFTLTAGRTIPPECDILVIAAPRSPYSARDAEAISAYLEKGGRLMYVAPPADADSPSVRSDPLNALVFRVGGEFRDDLVADMQHNSDGQRYNLLARTRGAGGGDARFVLPMTRSIRENPRAYEGGWISERLLESSPVALSIPSDGGGGLTGPFTLALRSSRAGGNGEARIVLLASSRMVANSDIDKGANAATLTSMAQWLAGREESYEIAPRPWTDRRMNLVGSRLRLALWLGLVALPLAWLAAGMTIWWLRKE